MNCFNCGSGDFREVISVERGGHYGRLVCSNCDRFIKWIPRPENEKKTNPRSEVSKKLVQVYSQGFCEICMRRADALPAPQTLEGHHIIPVSEGGTDDAENIQICCTACHRLIHHMRTYLGHYGGGAA